MAGGRRVRVIVRHSAVSDRQALEAMYRQVSARLAGTPGLRGNELWRSATEPVTYTIMSEWDDLAAFQAWAGDAERHRVTEPLRRFRTDADSDAEIYEVTAEH